MAWNLFGKDTPPEPAAVCDLILMLALADGVLGQEEIDGISRAMEGGGGLEGLSWDFVLGRIEALREDAPLFSDTRDRLASKLEDPLERKNGLKLAAEIASASRPLDDAERALLDSIARSFDITEKELEKLLSKGKKKSRAPASTRFVRSPFNDPSDRRGLSIFDHIAESRDDDELRILMFKLDGVRKLATALFENGEVIAVGELRALGRDKLRIDGVVESAGKRFLLRMIGAHEALWFGEHILYERLAGELSQTEGLILAHVDPLSLPDEALIKRLGPNAVQTHRFSNT